MPEFFRVVLRACAALSLDEGVPGPSPGVGFALQAVSSHRSYRLAAARSDRIGARGCADFDRPLAPSQFKSGLRPS